MVIRVECPACSTSFPVDPAKIPEGGVSARCSSCGNVFRVERPEDEASAAMDDAQADDFTKPIDSPPTADEPSAESTQSEMPEPEDEETGAADDWLIEPQEDPISGDVDAPTMFAAEDLPETSGPSEAFTAEEPVDSVAQVPEPTAAFERVAPEEPDAVAEAAPEIEPPAVSEALSDPAHEAVSAAPEPVEEATIPEPPPPSDAEAEARAEPEPGPAVPATSAPPVKGFTFGKRDPAEKARRLARVLVSDMIMYNPERHEKALSGGTLKEDFEDEIEKSWKEYVEQVGEEMAESQGQTFWADALNDVLAKGQQIF